VPEFWLTVLRTHPAVNELITPEDEDALKHLIDVRLSYTDDNHVRLPPRSLCSSTPATILTGISNVARLCDDAAGLHSRVRV